MLSLMSYSITVRSEGGQLTVESTGQVPDGTHVISGHEDDSGRHVAVARNHPEGHQLASTGASHSKEH